MSNGSGTRKWVLVLGVVVVLIGAWRLVSCMRRADTVEVGVVCTSCNSQGTVTVPAGEVQWPVECPKCGKPTAFVAQQCPKCHKPIPWDPKSPPTTCPLCKAKLVDETL